MNPIEARCPKCHRLLFRWAPRAYAEGSEAVQTPVDGGIGVEVRCSRCHSTITFSVPGGAVVGEVQAPARAAERGFATA